MLLDFSHVYRRDGFACFQERSNIFQSFSVRSLPGNIRNATHVWLNHDSIIPDEVWALELLAIHSGTVNGNNLLDFGFIVKNVEACTRDLTTLERLNECVFLNDRAS